MAELQTTTDTATQLDSLRREAGIASLTGGWISATGSDRVRWLNGMVTNSVQALTPGDGAYSFLLNAQGRIQGDCTLWAEADRILLETSAAQVEPITALLDRFIIMDDVELQPLDLHGLLIAGPRAAEKLTGIGIAARNSKLLKRQQVSWNNLPLTLITAYSPLVPRFELWAETPEAITAVTEALSGVTACSEEAIEQLRILEATPRVGADIRDRELPQETSQTRALHFNKGCYLGQEIVERIRSRGNVHRTFTAFTLTGSAPAPGTLIEAEGKPVGELTSIATAPIGGEQLALGYIRREALERGLPLTYAGGTVTPHTAAEPRETVAAS